MTGLCLALVGLEGACASQRQTGQLLAATGTAAAITGAVVLSRASCPPPYLPEYYQSYSNQYRCSPNRSGQTLGAAVAAAGLGAASLGYALEADAQRLDAWKHRARTRSSHNLATPPAFSLALPEPAFATPAPSKAGSPRLGPATCQCPGGALAACIEPPKADTKRSSKGPVAPEPQAAAVASDGNVDSNTAAQGTAEPSGSAGPSTEPTAASKEPAAPSLAAGPSPRVSSPCVCTCPGGPSSPQGPAKSE